MQQEPDLDPPPAGDPGESEHARQGAAGRAVLGGTRPTAQELDAALLQYRQDAQNLERHDTLLLLLYRSVALQAHELIVRQFRSLTHREDELVLRTLTRIEGREEGEHESKKARREQLLADYEFRPAGRAIYNYVLQKTTDIARNMQTEAYVLDGGFWSKDLKARFGTRRLDDKPGRNALRSGLQIEVPIGLPDDDDDPEAHAGAAPAGLRISETPMRHSLLRVDSLVQKLNALARDMVGKTITGADENGTAHAGIRLTVNHRLIWLAWLGLSHPDLIDLSEEDLADALGVSKATVTRDTSAAFVYMLQHPDLAALLVLMEPNRFQSSGSMAKELEVKLDQLESALRGRYGKRFFRKCVHQWLGEHV